MKIRIAAVGKIPDMYKAPYNEYLKRLKRYCDIEVCEVQEAKGEPAKAKRIEAEALTRLIPPESQVVALDIAGKSYSSVAFAQKLEGIMQSGQNICFILGGPEGFDGELIKRANDSISMSAMTFTHQMARVMLMEQLYRGFKIIKNEPYHK